MNIARNAVHRLRSNWHQLRASQPGQRFLDRYARHRLRTHARPGLNTAVNVAIGTTLLLVGTVLLLTPGPGILFIVLGLAVISTEWRPLAHVLDVSELKLRALLRPLHRNWTISRWPMRLLIVLASLAAVGGIVYGGWAICARIW